MGGEELKKGWMSKVYLVLGKCFYPNGAIYEGEWINGDIQGKGMEKKNNDGNKWKNGEK